jgi:hypothetical protein
MCKKTVVVSLSGGSERNYNWKLTHSSRFETGTTRINSRRKRESTALTYLNIQQMYQEFSFASYIHTVLQSYYFMQAAEFRPIIKMVTGEAGSSSTGIDNTRPSLPLPTGAMQRKIKKKRRN